MGATIPTRELVQVHELPRTISKDRLRLPGRVFTAQGPEGPACIIAFVTWQDGETYMPHCYVHDAFRCDGIVRVQCSGLLQDQPVTELPRKVL